MKINERGFLAPPITLFALSLLPRKHIFGAKHLLINKESLWLDLFTLLPLVSVSGTLDMATSNRNMKLFAAFFTLAVFLPVKNSKSIFTYFK